MKNTNEYNFKLIQITDVFAGEDVHNTIDSGKYFLKPNVYDSVFCGARSPNY